jgi:hypothetical protein
MRRIVAALLFLSLSFLSCAEAEPSPPPRDSTESSPDPETSPPPAPAPIVLSRDLPDEGIAVQRGRFVFLLDVNGKPLEQLRGFDIAGNPGAVGVWLQRGRNAFKLDPERDRLVPVARKKAQAMMYEGGLPPDLEPPPGTKHPTRGVVGHWRYAYRSPSGVLLGQWSSECEVPFAYWIEPDGDARIITGEDDLSEAPESIALGWSGFRAIVLLPKGACGSSADPPGIYAFTSPGAGRLVYEISGYSSADMWGPT